MRQVFTSHRVENAEGVAELLRAEGIEVRITNGRSYKGNRRGTFKYHKPSTGPQPAVWVVRSEDQPRARALLRDAGLFETTRPADASFLPPRAPEAPAVPATEPARLAMRLRIVLLGAIALVVVLQYLR